MIDRATAADMNDMMSMQNMLSHKAESKNVIPKILNMKNCKLMVIGCMMLVIILKLIKLSDYSVRSHLEAYSSMQICLLLVNLLVVCSEILKVISVFEDPVDKLELFNHKCQICYHENNLKSTLVCSNNLVLIEKSEKCFVAGRLRDEDTDCWIIDSGSTNHITFDRDDFETLMQLLEIQ